MYLLTVAAIEERISERESISSIMRGIGIRVRYSIPTEKIDSAGNILTSLKAELVIIDCTTQENADKWVEAVEKYFPGASIILVNTLDKMDQFSDKWTVVEWPISVKDFIEILKKIEKDCIEQLSIDTQKLEQEFISDDLAYYMRTELVSYMLLNKILDCWSNKFYENYFAHTYKGYRVMIIHVDNALFTNKIATALTYRLESCYPEYTCKAVRGEIVGIMFEKQFTSRVLTNKIIDIILTHLPLSIERSQVHCWLSNPTHIVNEVIHIYEELRYLYSSADSKLFLRSKKVLEIYTLEQALYEHVLRCAWQESKAILDSLGFFANSVNDGDIIRDKAYFGHLWRNIDRYIFQVTGKRKSFPEKLDIDNKLEAVDNIDDMVVIIMDFIKQYTNELGLTRKSSFHAITEKMKEYIESKYYEDVSLDHIADEIGFSSYYLSKIFKKVEGINFKNYVIRVRMAHAKLLLAEGSMNVGEIARQVGYPNANYFSRAFREYCGISPSQFKKG